MKKRERGDEASWLAIVAAAVLCIVGAAIGLYVEWTKFRAAQVIIDQSEKRNP